MKLWEIFRFEMTLQARRISTWFYFVVLLGFTYMMGTEEYVSNARNGGYFLNAPFVIASVATIGSMIGLLITASLAGDAGARDVQTRMHPLLYTTPVGKANYLRGRFLAAFILNLLILVAVPVGLVLAALVPRAEADLIGPFRRALDFPFAVVAHEVAHQWWGHQVTPALVEGAPVLTESLAWYSAMMVMEKTYGHEHLRRLLKGAGDGTAGCNRKLAGDSRRAGAQGGGRQRGRRDRGPHGRPRRGWRLRRRGGRRVRRAAVPAPAPRPLREQRITVTVPRKPARAGIDPRSLLIDVEATDNLREITAGAGNA